VLFAVTFELQENEMSVQLTETAAQEIKRVIEEQKLPAGIALRIGVAGGGCSGFEYKLGFDEKVDEQSDIVREMHGIRVVVDKKSLLHLDGTEIDYHNGIEKRGFVFNNPNATKSCGCGSSFDV
jgi:iron-sulfur cluster assembly protein